MVATDLARRTGLTEKALYMIETGRSDPSNSTLIKVAEAFELAVLELLP